MAACDKLHGSRLSVTNMFRYFVCYICICVFGLAFIAARQHIVYEHGICCHNSVHLSVCHTHGLCQNG